MKKWISFTICALLICLLAVSAYAAPTGPEITLQPQSPNYPNYSVAIYTVKATGTNLTATWYIEYEGKTYNASQIGGAMQPWEAYAGESYGAKKLDDNTFCFVFEGVEAGLNGATLWCEIEDGHYNVVSQVGYICVGDYASPPEILDIPTRITVEQGEKAEIRCVARSVDESQLSFIWYETGSGLLQDIQAVNRGTEDSDYMLFTAEHVGAHYYICGITTSAGGAAYSSAVEVNVVEKTTNPVAPQIQTESLAQATVGQTYSAQLSCSDPEAEYAVYFNPGKDNDFEKTGLTLSKDGKLSGTPTAPGSYTFCICAAGAGGEDYAVYTLTVGAAPETTPPATQPTTPATTPVVEPTNTTPTKPVEQTKPTTATTPVEATDPTTGTKPVEDTAEGSLPWWVAVLMGVVGAGAGVGVAVLLVKKKS